MINDMSLRKQMVIALYEIPGIGWHAIDKAVGHRLWMREQWTEEHLLSIGLRRDQASKAVALYSEQPWKLQRESSPAVADAGAVVLTVFDKRYPDILKEIHQPPWVLYAKGRLELLDRQAVAIVGTRVPTAYGRGTAAAMARELSEAGVTVVSGLARGIDSRAHEAALRGAGSTIAVLPTPIDRCYPAENESLYRAIGQQGLLLSETPIGTALHKGQFHQRNRVIAGLSRATIVVEGASKSGSLITADHAFELGRELFAVPGPVNSPKSEGPNELIRRGKARLISSTGQIFDELIWLKDAVRAGAGNAAERDETVEPDERRLIELLQDQPLSINELHELSCIPFGHLNALLLNLCIKRKIELQPGSIYIAL